MTILVGIFGIFAVIALLVVLSQPEGRGCLALILFLAGVIAFLSWLVS